jgi:hypothetical protein
MAGTAPGFGAVKDCFTLTWPAPLARAQGDPL